MRASWTFALACVLAPALWGWVMFHAFGWWDRRRRSQQPDKPEPPPIEYHI